MKEVRIYVEGGDDSDNSRTRVRRGFHEFFSGLVEMARHRRIGWRIIACGSRNTAYSDFQTALGSHPEALNVVLVDAEGPVKGTPWQHLRTRDGWAKPSGVTDDHCHLMAQSMEAWLIAEREAMRR